MFLLFFLTFNDIGNCCKSELLEKETFYFAFFFCLYSDTVPDENKEENGIMILEFQQYS